MKLSSTAMTVYMPPSSALNSYAGSSQMVLSAAQIIVRPIFTPVRVTVTGSSSGISSTQSAAGSHTGESIETGSVELSETATLPLPTSEPAESAATSAEPEVVSMRAMAIGPPQ